MVSSMETIVAEDDVFFSLGNFFQILDFSCNYLLISFN